MAIRGESRRVPGMPTGGSVTDSFDIGQSFDPVAGGGGITDIPTDIQTPDAMPTSPDFGSNLGKGMGAAQAGVDLAVTLGSNIMEGVQSRKQEAATQQAQDMFDEEQRLNELEQQRQQEIVNERRMRDQQLAEMQDSFFDRFAKFQRMFEDQMTKLNDASASSDRLKKTKTTDESLKDFAIMNRGR